MRLMHDTKMPLLMAWSGPRVRVKGVESLIQMINGYNRPRAIFSPAFDEALTPLCRSQFNFQGMGKEDHLTLNFCISTE